MRNPAPRYRSSIALIASAVTAAFGLGGNCDALDYSRPWVLLVHGEAGTAAVRTFEQPEIGRLALDWSVTNTGATDAVFTLDAQGQTSGSADDEACALFDGEPTVLVAADASDPESDAIPLVRDAERFYRIELGAVDGAFAGAANLRAPTSTIYEIRLDRDAVDLVITTDSGLRVVPDRVEVGQGACAEVQTRITIRLDAGVYRMTLAGTADRVGIVVNEACTEQRTVPRTCPGEASDVVRVDTGILAPGQSVTGRVGTPQLGVGDRVAVLLDCSAATPRCVGESEIFLVTEYLECRSTVDCAGNELCSEDGYCVRQPPVGCESGGSVSLAALVALSALGTRRRRARCA